MRVAQALLERGDRGGGVEAALAGEAHAQVGQPGDRVGAAPGAVEGQRQHAGRLLAQRVLGDVRGQQLDRGPRAVGTAVGELEQGEALEHDAAQLVEPVGLGARPGLVGELAQRRAGPQRERRAEGRAGGVGLLRARPLGQRSARVASSPSPIRSA